MPEWVRISGGAEHTLAIAKNGTLWAWGVNDDRQLGVGTPERRGDQTFGPLQIGLGRNWSAVAAGERHSLALDGDGVLWAWGSNAEGQCGTGPSSRAIRVPTRVGPDAEWTRISTRGAVSAGLKRDGSLWTWGRFTLPPWVPSRIAGTWSAVACGGFHLLAIAADGTLWAWGRNGEGQHGDGTLTDRERPVRIGDGSGWSAIAAGDLHSAALRAGGALHTWGYEKDGRLGPSANDGAKPAGGIRRTPGRVPGEWLAVTCDLATTIATSEDGVSAWGDLANRGSSELLRDPSRPPARLIAGDAIWEIPAGAASSPAASKVEPAYDLDEWAAALAAAVVAQIAASPPRDPVLSIALWIDDEARWPWSFAVATKAGGAPKRYDLDARCDCALPRRVDDEDRALDRFVEEHDFLRGTLSFAWNELPGALWRLALCEAVSRLPRELRKARVACAGTVQIAARARRSPPLGPEAVPELVAAARNALRLHFRNRKLLKRFSELCFRRPKNREWLQELRDSKRRRLTAWFEEE